MVPHAALVQVGPVARRLTHLVAGGGPVVRRLTHLVVGGRRCPGSTYWVNVRGRWVEDASRWVCLPPGGLRLIGWVALAGVGVGLVGR